MIVEKDGEYFETKEVRIDVGALTAEKAKLEKSLVDLPKLKTKPDQETLDLYNSFVQRSLDAAIVIQKKIDVIDNKLAKIEKV